MNLEACDIWNIAPFAALPESMLCLDMSVEDYTVTSEIHHHSKLDQSAKPSLSADYVVTSFHFKLPSRLSVVSNDAQKDEDGDYVVQRRNEVNLARDEVIQIEQKHSTTLQMVGLQVWRGALALADFVLDKGPELLLGATVLELGSGTGLTSIVASMFAKEVICTDIGDIIKLIKANKDRNKRFIKSDFSIFTLDFLQETWSKELQDKVKEVNIILAADVIYDNELTEGFVKLLSRLLNTPPAKSVYIALEKRYVFTVADLECVAPCYDHFMNCLHKVLCVPPATLWTLEQIKFDFPQYFNYDRVKDLVLWKVSSH